MYDALELPIIAGDDIRVAVVNQERRDSVYDLANVPMNHQTAFRCDIVRKGELGQIADGPCQQQSAPATDDANAARTFVARVDLRLALRKVEFFLFCLYVNVASCLLAKIDLRTSELYVRRPRFDGHVRKNESGPAFGGEFIGGVHGHTVTVCVNQPLVYPVLGGFRQSRII